jgi:hypothetical protein
MADDDCWAIRAQADALQSEVSTLRGAVAALRVARARDGSPVEAPRAPAPHAPWWAVAIAFVVGAVVALGAVALVHAALCT